MVLFRVDKREEASHGLLGYDWVEVLAIEPWALAFRTRDYGDWCDRRISNYYICLTEMGLIRITSDDFWAAVEEYGEYNDQTPQEDMAGIVINTGDASVVQTGGHIEGGVRTSRDRYRAKNVGAQGATSEGHVHLNAARVSADLAKELHALLTELASRAASAEDFVVVGAVAEAESAATRGDGDGVERSLVRAGKSALQTARDIGVEVAAAAITRSMGM